jgi:hypothetical protein
MPIQLNDLNELKRMSTNAYNDDKAMVNRIIKGIADYENVIRSLKAENELLRKQLGEKNQAQEP